MGKVTITMACGHDEVHDLFGKYADRERKIEYLKTCTCHACYEAKKNVKKQAINRELGELKGSEKQVAWAEDIRMKTIRLADNYIEEQKKQKYAALPVCYGRELTDEEIAERNNKLDEKLAALKSQPEAKFWIDNRFTPIQDLLK